MTRLYALARSHELLARKSYGAVRMEEVVRQALAPYFSKSSPRLTFQATNPRCRPRLR
ncbi:hypothetical protein IYX23_13410 [Methylocystis sp. L43]|nr:hypothetical protein [Methylocystis sp. L43]MBG0806981.1 hypothetical protein [Methylocystis sp. H15]